MWIALLSTALIVLGTQTSSVYSCTSVIGVNVTETQSNFVTYNADDSTGYGYLRFFPAGSHKPGDRRVVIDGDTREKHGDIPEAPMTFNVVHRANEVSIVIGESTWEGRKDLQTPFPGSIMDYESLMDIALQRAGDAFEAAGVITGLAELYGWRSLGETFSIADYRNALILEVIGKGQYGKGVVWALYVLPQGTVSAHANQPRITKCPQHACLMHPDTIPFARQLGYTGTDEDFSFSDFFQPLEPATVRATEARVWSVFQKLTNGGMDEYLNYAKGWDLSKRMPLYVKPTIPIDRQVFFDIMSDTYENTFFAFDNSDRYVGAGPYSAPYRARPLQFTVGSKTYVNERPIGTQQTLTSHVSEIRTDQRIPAEYRTIVWFSVDDTVLSARLPIYTGVTAIPKTFAMDSGDVLRFSFDSAYWVFNMVANFAYGSFKYIAPEIRKAIKATEKKHADAIVEMDAQLINNMSLATVKHVTDRIVKMGDDLTKSWLELWKELFMKYKDTYILTPSTEGKWEPTSAFQEVPASWYNRTVFESGDRFLIPSQPEEQQLVQEMQNPQSKKWM